MVYNDRCVFICLVFNEKCVLIGPINLDWEDMYIYLIGRNKFEESV